MAYCTRTISALITSPLQLTMPAFLGTPLKDVHAVSTTASTAMYMATVGAGSVCTYCMCVMSSGKSIISHGMSVIIMHFCKTFPVVCNYSTHDCTLIVLSADPEMMVVSVMATANTMSLCPFRAILSVMSVGDLIFHTATV